MLFLAMRWAAASAMARLLAASAMARASVWVIEVLTEAWLRRLMARKAMARKVMTESMISVITRATPRLDGRFITVRFEWESVAGKYASCRPAPAGIDAGQPAAATSVAPG